MMGWGLDKEITGSFSDYLSLMLGKPRIRLNNLKTSLRFPCLGLNPIIDSISLAHGLRQLTLDTKSDVSCLQTTLTRRSCRHTTLIVKIVIILWFSNNNRQRNLVSGIIRFTRGLRFVSLHRRQMIDSVCLLFRTCTVPVGLQTKNFAIRAMAVIVLFTRQFIFFQLVSYWVCFLM